MLNMIKAEMAKNAADNARPDRETAAADTLSDSAMHWAIHNCIGRTDARIRTYSKFGRYELSVKFAPGSEDGFGEGNSFYNDLVGNSNTYVADAICDIIYGREQDLISPLQTARLLNTYSAQMAKFVNDLSRLGYDVRVGDGAEQGNGKMDDSTIIISWKNAGA
jgi:hypothetical protein